MKPRLLLLLSLGCYTLAQGICLKPSIAQVTADGTTNTTVDADGNDFTITGEDSAGGNLFHSFDSFSVPTDGSAFFDNAADIANIFSRVTGGNISNIDGLIRTNDASLFLINPAGIIFGAGARLDLGGGSFYGSTADSILFPDDVSYSASDLNPPLLTVNAPIGLSFRDNPRDITVRGDGQGTQTTSDLIDTEDALRVGSNSTMALLGGDLNFEGATIKTAGGRIELGSVGANEQVNLTPVDEGFSFGYEGVQNFSDIQLFQTATVDASGEGGGNIQVQGQNITLTDGSTIEASTLGSLPGGNLNVTASETVELSGFNSDLIDTYIRSQVYPEARGTGGNITIEAKNLNIVDGASVFGGTFGSGNSGDITFNVSESINISSFLDFSEDDLDRLFAVFSDVSFGVLRGASGNGGNLTVNTQKFTIAGNVQVYGRTNGEGNAGNASIVASEFVEILDNPAIDTAYATFIGTDVNSGAVGNGGNLTVETPRLSLIGKDSKIVNGTRGSGNGGGTFINTSQLIIEGGAELQSLGFGVESSGNVGNITIEASDFVRVGGITSTVGTIDENSNLITTEGEFGGIFASAIGGGTGNGGNLTINTNKLIVEDFGTISVSNFQTLGLVPPGKGAAGNLEINANSVEVNNADITAANANGIGGNLTINANSLSLDNEGAIQAFTTSETGVGGIINLNLDNSLFLRDNSEISATADNGAMGGIINLNTDSIVTFPNQNSDILASAEEGSGGEINITTEALFGIEERPQNPLTNDIDASSGVGLDGTVSITTPEVDVLQSVVELPSSVVEPEQTVAQVCEAERGNIARSGLTLKGKGGVPPEPTAPLDSDVILTQQQNPQASYPDIKPIKTSIGDLMLARGVIKTESGEIILTAYPTDNRDRRTPSIKANCI